MTTGGQRRRNDDGTTKNMTTTRTRTKERTMTMNKDNDPSTRPRHCERLLARVVMDDNDGEIGTRTMGMTRGRQRRGRGDDNGDHDDEWDGDYVVTEVWRNECSFRSGSCSSAVFGFM